MASDGDNFYLDTLRQLVREGVMDTGMSILGVCAGGRDHRTLLEAGFRNATLTNLETRFDVDDPGPHTLAGGDVENLAFPDGSFDFVIAHNGLHHCASPHRGLLEMHRVARRGLLVFEPRDSLLSRLGTRLGLGQEYETAAVALSADGAHGGWRNGPVPNYVYRWTERCAAPNGPCVRALAALHSALATSSCRRRWCIPVGDGGQGRRGAAPGLRTPALEEQYE
jgi:ubiquinone/menaquinone biosynthesis C-methylase UbiE